MGHLADISAGCLYDGITLFPASLFLAAITAHLDTLPNSGVKLT
jgi:hypothetical protein